MRNFAKFVSVSSNIPSSASVTYWINGSVGVVSRSGSRTGALLLMGTAELSSSPESGQSE